MTTKAHKNGTPRAVAEPDVFTLEEAAKFLRVSVEAIRKEAGAGGVPGRLLAGEWRFSKSALLAWLGGRSPISWKERILDIPPTDETPEEQEEHLAELQRIRKSFGKVGRTKAGRSK